MALLAQDLREAVLQAAIEGRLTEYDSNEVNPLDKFEVVQNSNTLEGRRVKEKQVLDIEKYDEPFEIKNNWKWIRLGLICTIARGGSPRPIKEYLTKESDGVNWIKIGDTEKGGKYITKVNEKIKPSGMKKSRYVKSGDFLLTNSMSFGRPYILKVDGCIHDGWLVISQNIECFSQDFLYWLLSSNYAYNQFSDQVSGAVVKNLNSEKVVNSIFPLPPIEEQQRIVERVEELMSKIDEFEKIENKLETLKKSFPEDMKASLLQAAMQGKLTEQLDTDTSVEVEEEIPKEEIPFDIPKSWKWTYIGKIFMHNTGKTLNRTNTEGKMLEYITTSNLFWDRFELDKIKKMPFTDIEIEKYSVMKGDLLVCEGGDVGRCAIWNYDFPMRIQNHIHRLRPIYDTNIRFFYWVFYYYKLAGYILGKGIGIKGLSSKSLDKMLIPFPTIKEQDLIVDILDNLMQYCENFM